MNIIFSILLSVLIVLLPVQSAFAYIGPGLGVAAAYTLLGPVAAIITAILMIAYFPARYYWKKRKHEKKEVMESAEIASEEKTNSDS